MDPTQQSNKPPELNAPTLPLTTAQPISSLPQAPGQVKIDEKNEEANAQYAEALINMVNMNYADQHPKEKKHSRVVSDKQIVIVVILILATVLGTVIIEGFSKSTPKPKSSSDSDSSVSKQLINSAGTFGNPSSY